MKRALIIIVMLLAGLAATARAEGNRLLPLGEDEDAWVEGLFTDGETLYILGKGLTAWRAGDDAPRTWEDQIDLPGPEDGDGFGWRNAFDGLTLFMDGGTLRAGRLLTGEDGGVRSLQLCDIAFTEAGAVEARNVQTLNAPAAVRDSGLNSLNALCVRDGALWLLGYADEGVVLCAVDGDNPGAARVEVLGWNDFHLLPAPAGPILVEEALDEGTKLSRVGRDGHIEALCDLPPFTGGVAVDPATGQMYAVLDGRVRPVDLERGELGTAVSALPLDVRAAAALDGRYCAWMRGGVAVMDAGNALDEGGVLSYSTSYSAPWLEDVLLEFAVAHPELALARTNVPMEDALDGMLTQSREPDVFITDTRDGAAAYGALLERGYMLPLDGRDALSAFCERLYPGIRRGTSRDGALSALPLVAEGWGLGVSESLLARLGLSLADVPSDWADFLAFLEEAIRPRLSDLGPGAGFTYQDLTAEDFRYYLRMAILNGWINSAAAAGVVPDYEDARLVGLLEKVDAMDFTAFGLPEGSGDGGDDWGDHGYSYGSGDRILLQFSASYGFDESGVEGTPLLLDFGDDLPGTMALNMTAAFVNPYTAHPEAALDLLEALLENLPLETRYALCPDLEEPLIRPEYAQVQANQERMLAELQAGLDAAEAKDRQALEEEIAALEAERDEYERAGKWLISPERLQWYRAHGDRVAVSAPGWFGTDATGEAWQLLEQYDAGMLSAREFLAAVNRKARMMALEGN